MPDLALLRHAEAAPPQAGTADAERALTPNGRRQAAQVGHHLASSWPEPDLVLASPALRALTTARLAVSAAGWRIAVREEPRIYDATLADLRTLVDEQSASRVLLVGHNPGLSDLAALLAPGAVPAGLATAGLLTLRLAGRIGDRVRASDVKAWQAPPPAKS